MAQFTLQSIQVHLAELPDLYHKANVECKSYSRFRGIVVLSEHFARKSRTRITAAKWVTFP